MKASSLFDPIDRVDRGLTRLMAFGGLALAVYGATRFFEQWGLFALWWQIGGLLYVAILLCLVVGGSQLPPVWLSLLWRFVPALSLLLHLSWAWAVSDSYRDSILPWFWEMEPASTSLVTLSSSLTTAVVFAIVSPLAVVFSAVVAHGEVSVVVLENTPIHLTNIVFVILFVGIRRELKRVWKLQVEAHALEERRLKSVARDRALRQSASFIHDEILSTLVAALYSSGDVSSSLAAQARRTLEARDDGRFLPKRADVSTVATLAKSLESQIVEFSPTVHFFARPSELPVPKEAANALIGATMEALRNTVRHAAATCVVVTVEAVPNGVIVKVQDDGRGFEPNTVDSERLGIRESIQGRMCQIPGGMAEVHSRPGEGTCIEVSWNALGSMWDPNHPRIHEPDSKEISPGSSGLGTFAVRVVLCLSALASVASIASSNLFSGGVLFVVVTSLMIAIIALTKPGEDRLSSRRAVLVALGALGAIVTVLSLMPFVGAGIWAVDLASYAFALLIVRGNPRIGGLFGAIGIIVIMDWSISQSLSPNEVILVAGHPAMALMVGFVWLRVLQRIAERSLKLNDDTARVRVRAEAIEAATAQSLEEVANVRRHVAPLFKRIATGRSLSQADLDEARIIEAELRDWLRSPDLVAPVVSAAAGSARGRGVEVVLLGSSEPSERAEDAPIFYRVAELIDGVEHGRVTVRRVSNGPVAITLLIETGSPDTTRRLELSI